ICPTTGLFLPTGEGQPRPAEQERHNDRHGELPAESQPGASFVSRRRRRQAVHKRWRPAFVIASQLLEQLPYCSLFQILLHRKLHSLPSIFATVSSPVRNACEPNRARRPSRQPLPPDSGRDRRPVATLHAGVWASEQARGGTPVESRSDRSPDRSSPPISPSLRALRADSGEAIEGRCPVVRQRPFYGSPRTATS